jgi:hypothetical protein
VRATWVGRKYDKGIWRRITSSTASREAFLKERILNWRLEAPDDLQLVDGDQEEAPAALNTCYEHSICRRFDQSWEPSSIIESRAGVLNEAQANCCIKAVQGTACCGPTMCSWVQPCTFTEVYLRHVMEIGRPTLSRTDQLTEK